jgi:hypothetical protein
MNSLDFILEDINTQYTRKLIYAIYYRHEDDALKLLNYDIELKNQREILQQLEKELVYARDYSKEHNLVQKYTKKYKTVTITRSKSWPYEYTNLQELDFKDASLLMLAIIPNWNCRHNSHIIIKKLLEKYPNLNQIDSDVLFSQDKYTYNFMYIEYNGGTYTYGSRECDPNFITNENRQVLNNFIKNKYLEISHLNRDVDSIIIKYLGWN